ncbi:MAG TPA: tetratricopeptide repeat protein [Rhizomicrobium sp.]|nr:tetratricopeptide repeat protein [Rhizomicrobium sp.]
MLRTFASFLLLALVAGLAPQARAAIDPLPFTSHGPSQNKNVLQLLFNAQRAMQTGHREDAIHQLNLAASLEPNNPDILARLALALDQAGDYQGALDRLRRARILGAGKDIVLGPTLEAMLSLGQNQVLLDLYPDPGLGNRSYAAGMTLRGRAAALQALGDSTAATEAMKRSLAILTDYDGVMAAGQIALMQGDYNAADAHADAALKLQPGNTEARMLKIDLAMARRNIPAARQMADRLLADNPNSLSALLMRIKIYLVSDRPDVVEPDVDRVLAEIPDFPLARYFKAVITANRGDVKGAWALAHSLPKEFVQVDPGVAINVANMAIQAGYLDSGAIILSVAVQRFPQQIEPRLQLADIRLRQNSPQYALNALTMVQDSKDPRVPVLFARALLLKKDNAGAQKYIRQAIESGGGEELRTMDKEVALKSLSDYSAAHPDNKQVRKQYAILLLGFGELARARPAYERLVSDDPTDAVALNNLSWLVVQEDPARAVTLAQRAVKADPSSANNLDTLGSMQMSRSDFKGAIVSLKKARDLAPDNAEFSYHLALALEGSGQRKEAQAILKALVKRGGFGDLDAAKNLLASQLKLVGETQIGR